MKPIIKGIVITLILVCGIFIGSILTHPAGAQEVITDPWEAIQQLFTRILHLEQRVSQVEQSISQESQTKKKPIGDPFPRVDQPQIWFYLDSAKEIVTINSWGSAPRGAPAAEENVVYVARVIVPEPIYQILEERWGESCGAAYFHQRSKIAGDKLLIDEFELPLEFYSLMEGSNGH